MVTCNFEVLSKSDIVFSVTIKVLALFYFVKKKRDMVYTNSEMADMHFVYGLSNGNSLRAARLYAERYPNRQVPHPQTFQSIHSRLSEHGSFSKQSHLCGRKRSARIPAIEEEVLNIISDHPETSTRKIGTNFNISHQTIWRILKEQLLHPYHIQRVQALLPRDYPPRTAFAQWYLHMLTANNSFCSKILFTDEANFSKNAIMNFHNNHSWADENPHEIVEWHFQHRFSLNVWVGIIDDHLIGPYFFPQHLNGEIYRQFIEEDLPLLLEDLPLQLRNDMWFMHDGAPAHFSLLAREYLNRVFADRWIGRGGPQAWPPRSPDMNPLDFCVWGYLKSLVYTTPVENIDHLRNRIVDGCNTIRNTPGIFWRIRASLRRRTHACIMANGGHFEQFL